MTQVVLSLGSNSGDRAAALRGALAALTADGALRVLAVSPVYETVPVGGPPQPDYLNAVLVADTALEPRAVLARAREVESAHGRARSQPDRGERWGPRTLDVDIVAYGDLRRADPELTLPHRGATPTRMPNCPGMGRSPLCWLGSAPTGYPAATTWCW